MVDPVLLDGPNFVVVHFDGVSPNILGVFKAQDAALRYMHVCADRMPGKHVDVLRIELFEGVDTVSDDPDAGEGGAQ